MDASTRSAFERLRHLEPPGFEFGDGCLERPQFVTERAESDVVALVVHREPFVQPRDLGAELLEPAVDGRELLLGGAAFGAGEHGRGGGSGGSGSGAGGGSSGGRA